MNDIEKQQKKDDFTQPIWQIQKGEKPVAYKCFEYFCRHANSVKDVIKWIEDNPEIVDNELKTLQQREDFIYNYSKKMLWKERKSAYLQYIQDRKIKRDIKNIQEMHERYGNLAKVASKDMQVVIEEFNNRVQNGNLDLKGLNTNQLFNMVIKAIDKLIAVGEFERKIRGEPTEIIKNNVDLTSNGTTVLPQLNIQIIGSKSKLLDELTHG